MTADLQTALGLAKQGFRVFPLEPNSKTPAISGWPKKATCDSAIIKRWWTDPVMGWPAPWGVGVATGKGIVVVDLDIKHDGEQSLNMLADLNGALPETLRVRTPSDGLHLYFATDKAIKNSASKIAPSIDIRGEGGYVVAEGTEINEKTYAIEGGNSGGGINDLPAMPPWLLDLCEEASPRRERKLSRLDVPQDTPADIERAVEYLENRAPLAIEGSGGDETTYCVAARVKDLSVSDDRALDLMLDHWNERCSPPWDPQELKTKVDNAYFYGTKPQGADSPAADFEPIADIFETPKPRPLLYAIRYDDVEPDLHTVPLIEDIFDQGTMSVVYGDSNVGKSYVVLDMAYAIATGAPWHGKPVEQGAVIYVAAEGAGSMQHRIMALKTEHGSETVPMSLVPCPVDLLRKNADTQPLIELIRDEQEHFEQGVCFVAVDTLSRVLAGGNENTAEDMSALVRNLDRIRTETKAHVCIIHHTGKDKSKGARGSSVLRAATDTELEIERGVIKVTKQRDMEATRPLGFKLDTVKIGVNLNGKDVTACVVVPTSVSATEDFAKVALPHGQQKALEVLNKAIADNGVEPEDLPDEQIFGKSVTLTEWRDRCRGTISKAQDKEDRGQRQAFDRARNILEKQGLIEIYEEYVWVKE